MNRSIVSINGSFYQKHIVSLDQFDVPSLQFLFTHSSSIKKYYRAGRHVRPLEGKVATLLFFEPSSRTFSSFTAAMKRLGGQTVEYQEPTETSSTVKGESLEDTINVFEHYADCIIIRHPVMGTALKAANASIHTPIINAGDGYGEHPTQALLDMFTIFEKFDRLNDLTILMTGDLLYGRTVHSLLKGLSLFKGNSVYMLAPKHLRFPQKHLEEAKKRGVIIHEIERETEIPKSCNVWYWTRVQKERFKNLDEYEKLKHAFVLTPQLVQKRASKRTIFMHPLPRVGEIDSALDADPRALYLRDEVANGLYIRMALLHLVLEKKIRSFL